MKKAKNVTNKYKIENSSDNAIGESCIESFLETLSGVLDSRFKNLFPN